jgi:hypothetical protein
MDMELFFNNICYKKTELARILSIDVKNLEKAVVIELKHSLPAYL